MGIQPEFEKKVSMQSAERLDEVECLEKADLTEVGSFKEGAGQSGRQHYSELLQLRSVCKDLLLADHRTPGRLLCIRSMRHQ